MKKINFPFREKKQKVYPRLVLTLPTVGVSVSSILDNCCVYYLHLLRLIKYPPSATSICDCKLSKLRMDSKERTE